MTESNFENRHLLMRNPILAQLGGTALDHLAGASGSLTLRAGDVLFHGGAKADRVFLVLEGRLEVLLDDEAGNRTRMDTAVGPRLLGVC